MLLVTGMSCAACAGSVESLLSATHGVKEAKVNYGSGVVDLTYQATEISLTELKQTVQSIGYDLIIEDEDDKKQAAIEQAKALEYKSLLGRTILSLFFTMPIMIIAMGFPGLKNGNVIMLLLSLPVVFWSGRTFYSKALLQLKHRMVTMDTLVALSTSIAFLFSLTITLFPDLLAESGVENHVYYEAAAVIISFVLLGKLLEERARSNTSSAIRKLMRLQPDYVDVINDGDKISRTSIKAIVPGLKILVKPGEQIPIDGKVISGDSYVDESMITGEPMPAYKAQESKVFAGTINGQGSLRVIAETKGSETVLAKIIRTVQEAQGSMAGVQKLADKVAALFVPIVLGISALTFIAWMILGGDNNLTYALITSISVLVIACPCALGLATPTAIMVGMGRGAENHILIKDAQALETLSKVSCVAFDKTGTITQGKPEVVQVDWHIEDNSETPKYIAALCLLESASEHPLSEAITSHFMAKTADLRLSDFKSHPGRGVYGKIDEVEYYAGNRQFLSEQGISLAIKSHQHYNSEIFLAAGNRHVATIALADKVKTSAIHTIEELKRANYEVILLSGDNKSSTKAVSDTVGIKAYYAELLPGEKTSMITRLQKQGHTVAMVGDGINDSEALARADIGIAMGSGSDIAMEVAQLTLRSNDPYHVIRAIALSQQTTGTIKQNLFWAFVYNLIGIPIAAGVLYMISGFLLNPMIAAAAMALSSVSVVTNSLLLKRKPLRLKPVIIKNRNNSTMETYNFKTNINCGGCIAAVTPKLEAVPEINSWHVDTDNPDKILTVELEKDQPELVKQAVKEAGFTIERI